MAGSDTASLIWYLAVLVLVGSALMARRIALRSAIGMIIAWIGIFTIVLAIASYHTEIGALVHRVSADLSGTPRQSSKGGLLRIAVGSDGHYWVDGTINNMPARFLIDSGATITALSASTARAATVELDTQRAPVIMDTANGQIEAQRAVADRFEIGSIRMHNVPVVVSKAFGNVNVIGMNTLSQLKSWRVENRAMVLEP